MRQGVALAKRHGLKHYRQLSQVCATAGPAADLLAFCLQFEDRVVLVAAALAAPAEPKAVNLSSVRTAFAWASRGLCAVRNLATGACALRDALELFSNELQLSFDVEQRLCFLELRPVPQAEAQAADEQAALDASFELMLAKAGSRRGPLVDLWCLREVLAAVRAPDFSETHPAVLRFVQRLALRLGEAEQLKHMFANSFEIRPERKERLLLWQALAQHEALFVERVRPAVRGLFEVGNLVFVTPEYRGVAMAGGIATMVSDLCECLQRMGQRVTVVMPYYHLNG